MTRRPRRKPRAAPAIRLGLAAAWLWTTANEGRAPWCGEALSERGLRGTTWEWRRRTRPGLCPGRGTAPGIRRIGRVRRGRRGAALQQCRHCNAAIARVRRATRAIGPICIMKAGNAAMPRRRRPRISAIAGAVRGEKCAAGAARLRRRGRLSVRAGAAQSPRVTRSTAIARASRRRSWPGNPSNSMPTGSSPAPTGHGRLMPGAPRFDARSVLRM